MKLMTFSSGTDERVGVVDLDRGVVRDVTGQIEGGLAGAIESWATVGPLLARAADAATEFPLAQGRALAPIPRPRRNIFAVGKNYRDHVAEFGRSGYDTPDRSQELPAKPVYFTKATTTVTGPFDDVDPHKGVTSELDYEGELGVIIGPVAVASPVTARWSTSGVTRSSTM